MTAFICNGMLGKLCTFLRMCGFDAAYSNKGTAILVQARREDRILLTRNTNFVDRDRVFFLSSTDPLEQLHEVIEKYHMKDEMQLFSRCLECNVLLEPVEKTAVQSRIPYYTFKHYSDFSECPQCCRVYWKGSHYKKMIDDIAGALGTNGSPKDKQ